jgi:hypothetical protein
VSYTVSCSSETGWGVGLRITVARLAVDRNEQGITAAKELLVTTLLAAEIVGRLIRHRIVRIVAVIVIPT